MRGLAWRPFVLVADDNEDILALVSHVLGTFCEVATVCDGEAAWSAIKARQPDLLLTDVAMPKLDGLALLQRLRHAEQTRSLVVILHSSLSDEELHLEDLVDGPDDYLRKPFGPRDLVARVKERLVSLGTGCNCSAKSAANTAFGRGLDLTPAPRDACQ